MEGSKIESGFQLMSRLSRRPTLGKLNPEVFFHRAPVPNEFIEISGDSKQGKTLLLTDSVARCILPERYNGIELPGCECGVVLIDCNHQFNLLKLISVIKALLKESSVIIQSAFEGIINACLNNLVILNCYDQNHLRMTFYNLERIVSDRPNIGLVVLDNISAYYWQHRHTQGVISTNGYHMKILELLEQSIRNFNLTVLYSTGYIEQKSKEPNVQKEYYKIVVRECEDKFTLSVFCDKMKKNVICTFENTLKVVDT